jgi:hypothetical protein
MNPASTTIESEAAAMVEVILHRDRPEPTTTEERPPVFDAQNPYSDPRIISRAFAMLLQHLSDYPDLQVSQILQGTIVAFEDEQRECYRAASDFLRDQLLDWT